MSSDPPLNDRFKIKHVETFSGIVSGVSKSYRWRFDEALRSNPEDARAMRRDGWLIALLRERQMPVARAKWHIEGDDPKDPREKQAADLITAIIKRIPRFSRLRMNLRECDWYGKYGVDCLCERINHRGQSVYTVTNWKPIHGDKIIFRWDGTPAILVQASKASHYRDKGATVINSDRGPAILLNTPSWRDGILIDTFEVADADWYEPDLAGAVQGLGLRHHVHWLWWLRAEVKANLLDYMSRVGAGGLTVVYYEAGNPESEEKARDIARELESGNTVICPRPAGTSQQTNGIERIEAGTGGAELLISINDSFFDDKIERLFVGQSASASSKSSGMGTHDTDLQADTKFQLIAGDASDLDDTLTSDLVAPLVRWNIPGADFRLRFVTDLREPDNDKKLEAVNKAYSMGVDFIKDEVRQLTGMGKPQPEDETLSQQQQQMNAMAMGGQPLGMPGQGGMQDGMAVGGPAGVDGGDTAGPAGGGEGVGAEAGEAMAGGVEGGPPGDESSPQIQAYFEDAVESGKLFTPAGLKQLKRELQSGGWRWGINTGLVAPGMQPLVQYARSSFLTKLHIAANDVEPNPTDEQKKAGNYRKGHVSWKGLPITIETAQGQDRCGVDKDGKRWSVTMQDHYGYIKRTESEADGDHIDVFLSEDYPDSDVVFVVNQLGQDGSFDEHKCILGQITFEGAKAAYLRNYAPGWKGFGSSVALTVDQFKHWIESGDTGESLPETGLIQYAREKAQWRSYRNPETGQSGWISAKGRVVYEDPGSSPDEHPHGRKSAENGPAPNSGQNGSQPQESSGHPGEKVRRHVGVQRGKRGGLEGVSQTLSGMLDNPETVTPQSMTALVDSLMGLTVQELNVLRQQYGGKRGRKGEMVQGLSKRLQDEGLPGPNGLPDRLPAKLPGDLPNGLPNSRTPAEQVTERVTERPAFTQADKDEAMGIAAKQADFDRRMGEIPYEPPAYRDPTALEQATGQQDPQMRYKDIAHHGTMGRTPAMEPPKAMVSVADRFKALKAKLSPKSNQESIKADTPTPEHLAMLKRIGIGPEQVEGTPEYASAKAARDAARAAAPKPPPRDPVQERLRILKGELERTNRNPSMGWNSEYRHSLRAQIAALEKPNEPNRPVSQPVLSGNGGGPGGVAVARPSVLDRIRAAQKGIQAQAKPQPVAPPKPNQPLTPEPSVSAGTPAQRLTPREQQVHDVLSADPNQNKAAATLGVSRERVRQLANSIKAKLGQGAQGQSAAADVTAEANNRLLERREAQDREAGKATLPQMSANYDKNIARKAGTRQRVADHAEKELDALIETLEKSRGTAAGPGASQSQWDDALRLLQTAQGVVRPK